MDVEEAARAQIGQIIAEKYRLLGLLGAGGMGAVYEAEHVFTKRRVALKRMHPRTAKSKLAAERFLRESQAPSSIGHPGIVQVLDGGREHDGSLYLVLELLEGVSMREALEEGSLAAQQVVQIGLELLDALASAHSKGFVHRDIKPDNVFLAHDGRGGVTVKLLDFGIASLRGNEPDVKLTQTGAVVGTPLYMSPEQATGQCVDARSDLWSVGAVLYQSLSGASPFEGESYNALIVSIVTQGYVPLSDRRGDLPAALCEIVERALQKQVDMRHQSAHEMRDALRSVSFDAPAAPQRHLQPLPQSPTRRWGWFPWALAAAALVPALFAMQWLEQPLPRDPVSEVTDSETTTAIHLQRTAATLEPRATTPQRVEPPPDSQPSAAGTEAPQPTAAPFDSPRQPAPSDGLTVEQVTRVLAAQQPQMQACLESAVVAQVVAGTATRQPLRLAIELQIAPTGRTDVVRTSGAVPAELERCVQARLREAVFPPAPLATEFRYPLIFESTIIGR